MDDFKYKRRQKLYLSDRVSFSGSHAAPIHRIQIQLDEQSLISLCVCADGWD